MPSKKVSTLIRKNDQRLVEQVADLQRQLAAAKLDGERLDWIASTNSMTSEEVAELINGFTFNGRYLGDIRTAIDAARQKEGK